MKRRALFVFLVLLFVARAMNAQQVPTWKLDIGEPIDQYRFLKNGDFLFMTSGKYAWLYNSVNGDKVYELKVKDFEKKGVQSLIGERYLVSTDEALQCYNALTGKILWEQKYEKISQDNYSDLSFIGATMVLRYQDVHIGVDLNTGKELWRTVIKYNGDLKQKGAWNYTKLEKQNKLLVLLDDDGAGLFEFANGKQVFSGKEYEINDKLIEKGRKWFYSSPDERYTLFLLDKTVAVLDVSQNKEIARHEIGFDADFEPFLPTDRGCVILGKEKVLFFNDSTANLSEVKASAGDFRTYQIFSVGDKEIFFAGLSDAMFAIDLAAGQILWRTKPDDPDFEGYAHRYIKVDGNSVLLTYAGGSAVKGTHVYLLSIDALTGKVNYKSPSLAHSRTRTPDWARSVSKFLYSLGGHQNPWGYDNIGFEYSILQREGNIIISTVGTNKLLNPETNEDGGEGVCFVDEKTGQIVFKDFVELSEQTVYQPKVPKELQAFVDGNLMCLLGDKNIALYDLAAKKRIWLSKETLKGVPRDAVVVDGVLYIKFGGKKFKVSVSPAKNIFDSMGMKVDDEWNEKPYGFAAYDVPGGALLWRVETSVDPGFLTPNFSLGNNYEPTTKHLYFGDEDNIYALQMRRDGGKYDYVFNLDKNKLGDMPFKKTYAIQEWPIGEVSTTTTGYGTGVLTTTTTTSLSGKGYEQFISAAEEADAYTQYISWGTVWGAAAKKCLRVVYSDKELFAIGKEGIALLNAEDGKLLWRHEWGYDQDNVQFMPKIIGDKLVYCVDRKLTSVELATGKTRWQSKEAKRPIFFVSPNDKFMYSIDKEVITGYEL